MGRVSTKVIGRRARSTIDEDNAHEKEDLRSVGREGTHHGRTKTLEEGLRTLSLQKDAENISSALVSAGRK